MRIVPQEHVHHFENVERFMSYEVRLAFCDDDDDDDDVDDAKSITIPRLCFFERQTSLKKRICFGISPIFSFFPVTCDLYLHCQFTNGLTFFFLLKYSRLTTPRYHTHVLGKTYAIPLNSTYKIPKGKLVTCKVESMILIILLINEGN